MVKSFALVFILALAGCAGLPQQQHAASPCAADEASYECQVERYQKVNVN